MKKDKIEEHVADKYFRLKKKIDQMLQTYNRSHRQIYDEAIGKHLMENDQVKMELLDQDEKQKAVAKHMSDSYISIAKQHYNIKPEKNKAGKERKFDEAEETMIARLVGGTTYQEIYQEIRQRGEHFTFDHFNKEFRPRLMKNLIDNLAPVPREHFDTKHIGDILRYVEKKQGKKIDFINKDALGLEAAVQILDLYEAHGQIAEKPFEKAPYFIPKNRRKKAA